MRQDLKARVLTVLVLALVLGAALAKKAGVRWADLRPAAIAAQASTSDPQTRIYEMLDAARAGDVKAYLASYGGPMNAALRQTIAETSERDFARYLRENNAAVKGVAVSDPRIAGGAATVRVEYVYEDRNEAQTMRLEKGPGGWKIVDADSGERLHTPIPYGSPVK